MQFELIVPHQTKGAGAFLEKRSLHILDQDMEVEVSVGHPT
jgi:hypothetical protein